MNTICRFAAVSLVAVCTGLAAEQEVKIEQFRMMATVIDVAALPIFEGSCVLAHFDPRFALKLQIESITPTSTHFGTGAVVTFAIHSLTKLFAGDTPIGKKVKFLLSREVGGGGKTRFSLQTRSSTDKTHDSALRRVASDENNNCEESP